MSRRIAYAFDLICHLVPSALDQRPPLSSKLVAFDFLIATTAVYRLGMGPTWISRS